MKIESLSLFDFFGFKPYFYLNGNKYYTTLFGFIISIISVLSMLGLTVYFILDMFDTNNFSIVISNIQTQSPPSFNWTNNVFYFGMALEDPITLDYYLLTKSDIPQGSKGWCRYLPLGTYWCRTRTMPNIKIS